MRKDGKKKMSEKDYQELKKSLRPILKKKLQAKALREMAEGTAKNKRNLWDWMFDICERDGAVTDVGPEYYERFLGIPEKGMETLIACILCDRAESINRKMSTGEWKTGEEIYEYVIGFLEWIAQGIMGFREKDFKLCFCKPVGDPPDEDTAKKLDAKIRGAIPLMPKVMLKVCKETLTDEKIETILKTLKIKKGGNYAYRKEYQP